MSTKKTYKIIFTVALFIQVKKLKTAQMSINQLTNPYNKILLKK